MCFLSETLGTEHAQLLQSEKGGTEIYVPMKPRSQHWLTQLLGVDLCEKLTQAAGGGRLFVPRGYKAQLQKRNDCIYQEWLSGMTPSEIAIARQMGERQVYRILERYRKVNAATL